MTSPSAKMILVASLVAAIVVTNTDDIGVEAGRHHLKGSNKSDNFTNSNRFLSPENGNMLPDESILGVSQTQNEETLRDLKSSKNRKSNKESKKQEKMNLDGAGKSEKGVKKKVNKSAKDGKKTLQMVSSPLPLITTAPSVQPSTRQISSNYPSRIPSYRPSFLLSDGPSRVDPSSIPSYVEQIPSFGPSWSPSVVPSDYPSSTPSMHPSTDPSKYPSLSPTFQPSNIPSMAPTASPSVAPTASPSMVPSNMPSVIPSAYPSANPSTSPSQFPSSSPSKRPSMMPSQAPSVAPSQSPSQEPSNNPSERPSIMPSGSPSSYPSLTPSVTPSVIPSDLPSEGPSSSPSVSPSLQPSWRPSYAPSLDPSAFHSNEPSFLPPSQTPSDVWSTQPSWIPSHEPSKPTPSSNLSSLFPSIARTTLAPAIITRAEEAKLATPTAVRNEKTALISVGGLIGAMATIAFILAGVFWLGVGRRNDHQRSKPRQTLEIIEFDPEPIVTTLSGDDSEESYYETNYLRKRASSLGVAGFHWGGGGSRVDVQEIPDIIQSDSFS